MSRRIESPGNPTIKGWRALHKRRARSDEGRFLIEGLREVSRAQESAIEFEAVVTGEAASAEELEAAARATAAGAVHYEVSSPALEKISFRQNPSQLIGVGRTPNFDLGQVPTTATPLLLIADAIEKPGNLGAMIRSADGAGVSGVIAAGGITDLVNPNTIRASQGALFSIPVAAAPTDEVKDWLAARGIGTVAATAEAGITMWDADLTGPVAIVVGSEHAGLSPAWRTAQTVSIPMAGISDSLNASVAAALLLYEAVRQRAGSQ